MYKGKLYTVCALYAHTERSIGAVQEQSQKVGVVAVLKATIDTLHGQLAVKDQQIEELNARLAEVSSALVVAQQEVHEAHSLHAGTMQQQLTGGADSVDGEQQSPEKKKKRWQFWK